MCYLLHSFDVLFRLVENGLNKTHNNSDLMTE